MMKRRRFIKKGLLMVSVLYGLSGRFFRFKGNHALASNNQELQNFDFSGSYSAEMVHDRILMPEAWISPLRKTGFDIVALKGNGFLLIPVNNPLVKLFDEIGTSSLFKNDFLVLRKKDIAVSDDGHVGIPREMQRFAGIGPGKVSIVGQRNLVEIVNPGK